LDPPGHLLYNATTTLGKSAVTNALAPLYTTRAVVPATPWLAGAPPGRPSIAVRGRSLALRAAPGAAVRWWVVRARTAAGWTTTIVFGNRDSVELPDGADRVLVTALGATGVASADASWSR
jgi:hypothetical protein